MKNMIIIVISLLLIVTGVSCVALSHYVTPADVDKQAVNYVVEADVAEPNEYSGWPNLAKALKLQRDVDTAHVLNQFEYQQLVQKDNVEHGIHKSTTSINSTTGLQREGMLFGEKGLLSLGLSLAGMGTLTGLIGLSRKRPGDITQQEMEQTLSSVTGKGTAELSVKNKQFIQIVKGLSDFMRTYKGNDRVITDLKLACNSAQDIDTQIAVSAAKRGT